MFKCFLLFMTLLPTALFALELTIDGELYKRSSVLRTSDGYLENPHYQVYQLSGVMAAEPAKGDVIRVADCWFYYDGSPNIELVRILLEENIILYCRKLGDEIIPFHLSFERAESEDGWGDGWGGSYSQPKKTESFDKTLSDFSASDWQALKGISVDYSEDEHVLKMLDQVDLSQCVLSWGTSNPLPQNHTVNYLYLHDSAPFTADYQNLKFLITGRRANTVQKSGGWWFVQPGTLMNSTWKVAGDFSDGSELVVKNPALEFFRGYLPGLGDLANCPKLKVLHLEDNPDLEGQFSDLKNLSTLRSVDLSNTTIKTLPNEHFPQLRWLNVVGCEIPAEEIEAFQAANPQCFVVWNFKRSLNAALKSVQRVSLSEEIYGHGYEDLFTDRCYGTVEDPQLIEALLKPLLATEDVYVYAEENPYICRSYIWKKMVFETQSGEIKIDILDDRVAWTDSGYTDHQFKSGDWLHFYSALEKAVYHLLSQQLGYDPIERLSALCESTNVDNYVWGEHWVRTKEGIYVRDSDFEWPESEEGDSGDGWEEDEEPEYESGLVQLDDGSYLHEDELYRQLFHSDKLNNKEAIRSLFQIFLTFDNVYSVSLDRRIRPDCLILRQDLELQLTVVEELGIKFPFYWGFYCDKATKTELMALSLKYHSLRQGFMNHYSDDTNVDREDLKKLADLDFPLFVDFVQAMLTDDKLADALNQERKVVSENEEEETASLAVALVEQVLDKLPKSVEMAKIEQMLSRIPEPFHAAMQKKLKAARAKFID